MAEVKLLVEECRDAIDVLTTWLPRVALAIVFVSVGNPAPRDHRLRLG